jgi:beta-lactamase class A
MRLSTLLLRGPLLAALCALALFARAAGAQAPDLRGARDAQLQQGLESALHALRLDGAAGAGRLSVALVDLSEPAAPRLAMVNGERMMYAASMPKVGILLGAMAEAEAGRFPLDAEHRAALTRMIRYSSNDDATRVLHWVGGERLLQILQSDRFRFYDAAAGGGLWVGKGYDSAAAFRRDPVGNLSHGATAFQVARLYTLLAANALLRPDLNALMKDVLSKPGIQHKFVAGLAGRPGVEIFRKSGTWRDTHADSALIEFGPYRYVLVAIAQDPDGGDWLKRLAAPLHDLIVASPRGAAARYSSSFSQSKPLNQ